jgi:hypothetical protein
VDYQSSQRLKVAEHELRQPADEIVTDAICFHCQQAVEKLLKAYLASQNIDFGNLSFYAVEIRYPDEFYMPSIAEAKECFSIASKDKNFLLKKISSFKTWLNHNHEYIYFTYMLNTLLSFATRFLCHPKSMRIRAIRVIRVPFIWMNTILNFLYLHRVARWASYFFPDTLETGTAFRANIIFHYKVSFLDFNAY